MITTSKGRRFALLQKKMIFQISVPGSLTMKPCPKPVRKKKTKHTESSMDDQQNEVITETSPATVIRQTKLEHMEIEVQTPVVDEQHFIIDDNIAVESNIEIEFITSDELLPNSEMETDAIVYDNSIGNSLVDEMDAQQAVDGDYDDGNESWDNVDGNDHQIIFVESELLEVKTFKNVFEFTKTKK